MTIWIGGRCCRWLLAHVGHQLDIDTAILSPACRGAVAGDLLILADSDKIELVRRNVVLRRQIVHDRVCATLAELVVVVGVAYGVRTAGHLKEVASCAAEIGCETIELLLVRPGKRRFIKTEGYANIGELLVIVEVGNDAAQVVDAVIRLLRGVIGCVGGLPRSEGVLVGRVRRTLSSCNATLRALIGVYNSTVVGSRLSI